MRPILLLVSIVSLVLGSGPAMAQTGENADKATSLLLLKTDGDQLGAAEKTAVADGLKVELAKYKKYNVVEAGDLDLLDAMVEYECLDMDAACLAAIAAKKNTDQVLYTKVEGGKATMLLVDVKSGKELARDERSAEGKPALQGALLVAGREAVFGPTPVEPAPAPVVAPVVEPPKPEVEVKKVAFTIDSNVKDSSVFINEKDVGKAPVNVKLKPGRYTFRVEREGFLSVEEKIQVAEVGAKAWKANLKPVPVQKAAAVVPVAPTKNGEKGAVGTPFYATWWFWTAVGAGVVAATVTTAVLMSDTGSSGSYGTAKFSIDPNAAAYDAVFYGNGN